VLFGFAFRLFFFTSHFSLIPPCVSSFSSFLLLAWVFPVVFYFLIIIGIIFITLTSSPLFPCSSSSLFSCCVTSQSSGLVFLNRIFCYISCFTTACDCLLNTLYIYIYICIYTHTHTHTHTYSMEQSLSWEPNRFSDIYLCVCVCVYIYIYIYIYIYTHTHTHTLTPWSRVFLENLAGFQIYTCVCIYIYTYVWYKHTHVCLCVCGDTWNVKANIGRTHQLTAWHVTFKQGRWTAWEILTNLGIHGKNQSVWYLYVEV